MPSYSTVCVFFTGYRPCRFRRPCEGCPYHQARGADILLINLDALGDVLRTTAILPGLRRAFPGARLTWLTRPRAAALLAHNPLIDRVMELGPDALAELGGRRFDLLLNADKSTVSGGLARSIEARDKRGFAIDPAGAIVPLNAEAQHLYDMGLDDDLKFRRNRRAEQDLLAEALGLEWAGEPYTLTLLEAERSPLPRRKVGFNTGCSATFPYKALATDLQAEAIRRITPWLGEPVVLLGGPEDEERNAALAAMLGERVELSPTGAGLRRGIAEIDRCEVIFTGDTLGMHLAIALEKHVVAWFGLTCPQEIHLYQRGIKLLAHVGCAPCWQPSCDNEPKCNTRLDPELIENAVHDCLSARRSGAPLDEIRGAGWWR